MTAARSQCPVCGYLLDEPAAACPVCHPHTEMPEHVKDQWAVARWRGIILHLAQDDAIVRESATWEETGLLEQDMRPLLARMAEDGEIERFAGYYRVRGQLEASA
jgi:RNA polymerase subunit RPABC4/transcription elongation factor Spt4